MTYLQLTLSKIKTFYTAHSFSASNADFQKVIQDWLFLMCLHELLWHRNDILYLQYCFSLLTGFAFKTWIKSKLCVLWYSLLMHNFSQTKQIPFESAVWYSVIVVWRFYICNTKCLNKGILVYFYIYYIILCQTSHIWSAGKVWSFLQQPQGPSSPTHLQSPPSQLCLARESKYL